MGLEDTFLASNSDSYLICRGVGKANVMISGQMGKGYYEIAEKRLTQGNLEEWFK